MAEAATAVAPFARVALQVGEVRLDGRKMAKSVGNLVLVADLLERQEPPAMRLGLLGRSWAKPWDCAEDVFVDAAKQLADLRSAASVPDEPGSSEGGRRSPGHPGRRPRHDRCRLLRSRRRP